MDCECTACGYTEWTEVDRSTYRGCIIVTYECLDCGNEERVEE
jgi:predicted nucleic-acid-binding Zn-ribbon protein